MEADALGEMPPGACGAGVEAKMWEHAKGLASPKPGNVARCFSPTAESFGVSAQIGSGVVRGGPEVRFHEGSTRVPPNIHKVLRVV